jgi:hypothetical protein
VSWWPRHCPVCRRELPERGNSRRYVPWVSPPGFKLVHAGACAEAIDAQGVLDLERPVEWHTRTVLLIRRLAEFTIGLPPEDLQRIAVAKVAQLLGREEEGGEPLDEPLEDIGSLCRRLSALDQAQVARAFQKRVERRLLSNEHFVEDGPELAQLAHGSKVSAPGRTEAA